MSKRHQVMLTVRDRPRCACGDHVCSGFAQLGDPLCGVCRLNCFPESIRRHKRRRLALALTVAVGIFAVSWLVGRLVGPLIAGG